jgi:glyoxylase-like metal-dependent hydrolase (beta-lactamase superfamily II)
MLDLGWPPGVEHDVDLDLPLVTGLATGTDPSLLGVLISHPHSLGVLLTFQLAVPSLLGVLISHPHFDHYGLLAKVPRMVPMYIGKAAARILHEGAFFHRDGTSTAWSRSSAPLSGPTGSS